MPSLPPYTDQVQRDIRRHKLAVRLAVGHGDRWASLLDEQRICYRVMAADIDDWYIRELHLEREMGVAGDRGTARRSGYL